MMNLFGLLVSLVDQYSLHDELVWTGGKDISEVNLLVRFPGHGGLTYMSRIAMACGSSMCQAG